MKTNRIDSVSFVEVEAEILESNIDEAQLQRLRNGERPGALWHLFRADDAKKIREYIGRVSILLRQRSDIQCFAFSPRCSRLNAECLVRIPSMTKPPI